MVQLDGYMPDYMNSASNAQGGSYNNPMNNFQGSIFEMTSTEELLFRFEKSLSGESINEKGEIRMVGYPLLNPEGIKNVIGIVRSAGSQSSVMSDFKSSEVGVLMDYLSDTLAKDLMINRINYDIVNPSARETIVFMAVACTFAIIKRGHDGGERRFWKGSQQELTIKGEAQKKGNMFTSMFKK